MRKKLTSIVLSFCLVLASAVLLTACGPQAFDASKLNIGTTEFTYDGSAHVFEVTYEQVEVSVTYAESKEDEFKPANQLSYKQAGTYNLFYKVTADGYEDFISQSATPFTINKRALTIAVDDTTQFVGESTNVTPTLNVVSGSVVAGDNVLADIRFAFSGTNNNAGEVGTVTASVLADSNTDNNYNITFTNNPADVNIIDAVQVTIGNTTSYYSTLSEAVYANDTQEVIYIKLMKDIVLTNDTGNFYITKNEYVIDLNGHNVSFPEDTAGDGIFRVEYDGKLTINGEGIVNSASLTNDYSMAVWANLGGEIIINGGTYTNVGAKDKEDDGKTANNNDMIYASRRGAIVINGGTFIGNYENSNHGSVGANGYIRYALNIKDADQKIDLENGVKSITVRGGEFYSYDPADSLSENPAGNFVEEGYVSTLEVRDGVNWYVVTAESQA